MGSQFHSRNPKKVKFKLKENIKKYLSYFCKTQENSLHVNYKISKTKKDERRNKKMKIKIVFFKWICKRQGQTVLWGGNYE